MTHPELLASMRAAVQGAPEDAALRLHLAQLLLESAAADEALHHIADVLQRDPASGAARTLMARALGVLPAAGPVVPASGDPVVPGAPDGPAGDDGPTGPGASAVPDAAQGAHGAPPADPAAFDWHRAEGDLGDRVPPMFTDGSNGAPGDQGIYDVERPVLRLADVGGMTEVKERLEAAFLAPLRNPELRRLYGKSLRGGLLLYGPPGCGKTFIAKAVAGEMGAQFLSVALSDVLDMWIGSSERNVHDLFEHARRSAPCVMFLDEVDAIGLKRTQSRNSGTRGTVNQLLAELDGVVAANDGVFVLAASNAPWDIDGALRRPGRLDRTLLVLPPDQAAREAVLRHHLKGRPVAGIDLRRLAKRTEGYSGADLAHICETGAERAMLDAVRTGEVRMIEMRDLEEAAAEVKPSTGPWFDTARNVALFANEGGTYDDLLVYLKKRRML